MRTGDLVCFKNKLELRHALVLGGHRDFESRRYWWIDNKYYRAEPTEVWVLLEKNPKLYGIEAPEIHQEKSTAILMDLSTKRFLLVKQRQVELAKSVQRPKT